MSHWPFKPISRQRLNRQRGGLLTYIGGYVCNFSPPFLLLASISRIALEIWARRIFSASGTSREFHIFVECGIGSRFFTTLTIDATFSGFNSKSLERILEMTLTPVFAGSYQMEIPKMTGHLSKDLFFGGARPWSFPESGIMVSRTYEASICTNESQGYKSDRRLLFQESHRAGFGLFSKQL